MKFSILIADDSETDPIVIKDKLIKQTEFSDASFEFAHNPIDAVKLLDNKHFDLVLLDLFFDSEDQAANSSELYEKYKVWFPIILISGKTYPRINNALGKLKKHLKWVQKPDANEDTIVFAQEILKTIREFYNLDIKIIHRDQRKVPLVDASVSLQSGKLKNLNLDKIIDEVESLIRKAFSTWDSESTPKELQICELTIYNPLPSNDRSVVMQIRPQTSRLPTPNQLNHQADIILKVNPAKSLNDCSDFQKYKRIIGGNGLYEHWYGGTKNLRGQIYSVPYSRFDETTTYLEFFQKQSNLNVIHEVTKYLFHNLNAPFRGFRPQNCCTKKIKDYYSERINLAHRITTIKTDVIPHVPDVIRHWWQNPNKINLNDINNKSKICELPLAKLVNGVYTGSENEFTPCLQHGDLHITNVIVDEAHKLCWYIDYERISLDHSPVTDLVEFEVSILFCLLQITDFRLLVSVNDAITPTAINDLSGLDSLCQAISDQKITELLSKLKVALQPIRDSIVQSSSCSAQAYYQALMYESIRAAGHLGSDSSQLCGRDSSIRRWHALITAAQLFAKIETMS